MNPTINLYEFVSDNPEYPKLHNPWVSDGFTYATNGDIIVRLNGELYPEKLNRQGPDVKTRWKWNQQHNNRRKWIRFERCPACQGRKTERCSLGHEHDCRTCRASGLKHFVKNEYGNLTVKGEILSVKYVTLISSLPNAQICPTDKDEKTGAIPFRFDGGCGYVMPMVIKWQQSKAR